MKREDWEAYPVTCQVRDDYGYQVGVLTVWNAQGLWEAYVRTGAGATYDMIGSYQGFYLAEAATKRAWSAGKKRGH